MTIAMINHECWMIIGIILTASEVLAVFLAFLPFILLTGIGAQPFQRGFFCDDESIRYPYKPDTVSLASLYLGTLLISTAIILLVEMSRYIYCKCTANEPAGYSLTPYCSITRIIFVLYNVLGSMYFGFAVVLSLVDVGKYSSGRLKPYFIAVCRPDPASYNCSSSGPSVFVENYRCQETNMITLSRARQSFPTLHTTLTHYFAAYLLIYLQVRLTWKPIRMLRHVLQAGCYAAAIYVSISRVGENAHFFSDVIVSVVLGNVIGILAILFVCGILCPASDSTQEKKLLQQEVTVTAASGVDVRPVFEVPKSADANLPVYNLYPNPSGGGGGNIYGFQGNGGGYATAYSPVQMQQQSGMFSSFVRYS